MRISSYKKLSALAAATILCRHLVQANNTKTLESTQPSNYTYDVSSCKGYTVTNVNETETGLLADLILNQANCTAFGFDIEHLVLNVSYDTQQRLHVHVYDQAEQQWQVPSWLIPRPSDPANSTLKTTTSDLVFDYTSSPFEFWVSRRSDGDVLFDTRNSSLPVYDDVIPSNDLGEAGFVDDISYRNNTALKSYPFVFENQYIQIASALPNDANIYGLGYAVASSGFRRNNTATVQPNWAADRGDAADSNIYGSFPFYVEHRITNGTGQSHGVFLMSSEGMDIILREGVIEYRIVGGTLDLTFMSGPTPTAVIQQYGEISEFSQLPPLYALGFNLCRWGYKNVNELEMVHSRMANANIPLETLWSDIDWMHSFRDFVPDPISYSPTTYKAFVDKLNANNQHYTMIIDAAINIELNDTDVYDTYRQGTELDVFMKNPDGSNYIGQVWPGATVFPDWFSGNAQQWWTKAFKNLSEIIQFSGIWLDMNEASSFCIGSCFSPGPGVNISNTSTPFLLPGAPGNPITTFPEGYNATLSGYSGNITVNGTLTYMQAAPASAPSVSRNKKRMTRNLDHDDEEKKWGIRNTLMRREMLKRAPGSQIFYPGQSVDSEQDISFPPYMLHNAQDEMNLGTHALAPNATHANGAVELDVHNLWGFMEEKATHAAYQEVHPGKRPYLISRSLFTGSGKYTGAWGGDNSATWEEMERSIQVILSYQMYHVALIGVDSCGFNGNTDEELCNRWMQLGAFSPFFRNHNVLSAISQEPYIWDSVAEASRVAIAARYRLLPYWYTQFAKSHFEGTPTVNALIFAFPNDASLLSVSSQYLVGTDLLVTPVLQPNQTTVTGLFPEGDTTLWRDWWTYAVLNTSSGFTSSTQTATAVNVTLDAPLGHIPIHIRGGSIMLLYAQPGYTTTATKQGGFELLASLDGNGTASGTAYQDDGISYPVQTDGDWFTYNVYSNQTLVASSGSGSQSTNETLKQITVLGVQGIPSGIHLNGTPMNKFTYDQGLQKLVVPDLDLDINPGFVLVWA